MACRLIALMVATWLALWNGSATSCQRCDDRESRGSSCWKLKDCTATPMPTIRVSTARRQNSSQSAKCGDPIARLEQHLLDDGCEAETLQQIRTEVQREVAAAEAAAATGTGPATQRIASCPIQVELQHPSSEIRGDDSQPEVTMGPAINAVLQHHLQHDPRLFLYGQDIEDPKGDVFGVTKGLSTAFAGRVRNAPLSESTILGTSIGRALAGQKPVAFIQFADFLPLAYNQLTSELANMYWRTDGDWQAPVVVMVACGAYRPGLGPYHAQTLESAMAHTPGLDVMMPSTATDAAGMLNAALRSDRPTLFLYPKAMLNDTGRATSADVAKQFVPIGTARKIRTGREITFVAWGNTVPVCERAAQELERVGVEADIIDLRCLAPWDKTMVLASAEKTSRLIVVHEDNHTCGFGGEVIATVAEESRFPVAVRRVTRLDTFIPCNYANQLDILPTYQSVLAIAAELLNFDLSWEQPNEPEEGYFDVPAIGSAPSDESVIVVDYLRQPGSHVERGDVIVEVEASKSVFEITTPVAGHIDDLLVEVGQSIAVGKPLVRIRTDEGIVPEQAVLLEQPGQPILVRRQHPARLRLPSRTEKRRPFDVGISAVSAITGSRIVSNQELLSATTEMTPEDVIRLTGIESRQLGRQRRKHCQSGGPSSFANAGTRSFVDRRVRSGDLQHDQPKLGDPVDGVPGAQRVGTGQSEHDDAGVRYQRRLQRLSVRVAGRLRFPAKQT